MDPENRNNKINKILNSLDGIERAAPAPFFLTRLNARLANPGYETSWMKIFGFLNRPVVAGLALTIFLFVNFIVITSMINRRDNMISQTSSSVKYEFAINVSSIYDVENPEP